MELVFNELSIHGQFRDINDFQDSVDRVMQIRTLVQKYGRKLRCPYNLTMKVAVRDRTMQEVISKFDRDKQRAFMSWLTKDGPFWEEDRTHSGDEYLECRVHGLVTDSAVGEVAYRRLQKLDWRLVSMTPSSWECSPVKVDLCESDSTRRAIDVPNYWEVCILKLVLSRTEQPLGSWQELESAARSRCSNLIFCPDSFQPLQRHPFIKSAADAILSRFEVLHELRNRVDRRGKLTSEGQDLYDRCFKGGKAWFSDSSDTEKNKYKERLTFQIPSAYGKPTFCPWHGKVKNRQLQLRIHFSSLFETDVYVVYVGPKITM